MLQHMEMSRNKPETFKTQTDEIDVWNDGSFRLSQRQTAPNVEINQTYVRENLDLPLCFHFE